MTALSVALSVSGLGIGHADDGASSFWSRTDRVEVAAGNARLGPWRMNESDFDFVSDPAVAVADDGHVGVAWADQARQRIVFQMYGPDGAARFAEPVDVPGHTGVFSWLPRVVIPAGDARRVYLLWQEIVFSGGSHGGEILFARSTNGGATFDTPVNLSNTEAGAGKGRLTARRWDNGSLDLAAGPEGRLYAAWTEYEGRLWLSRSTDGGATFSAPVHVTGDVDRPARAPAIAMDSDGRVHLAWTVGEDASADIRVATSADGGRSFGEPQRVGPGAGHADAPKIVADSQDRLHLVYGESPDGMFGRYHIRYAGRDAGSGSFSEPRTIVEPWAGLESVHFPGLAADAADRLYVAWELFPDRRQRPRGLGFAVSHDGGETFSAPEVVAGSDDPELGINGSLQGSLTSRLAVDVLALALVGSTFAPDETSHVWLWRKAAAAR